MALRGSAEHFVLLDQGIKTIRDTGRDMQDKYKETAHGVPVINMVNVAVSTHRVPSSFQSCRAEARCEVTKRRINI